MSLTADIWESVSSKLRSSGVNPKDILPDWNSAMRRVYRDGQIKTLEAIASEMQSQGSTRITYINPARIL